MGLDGEVRRVTEGKQVVQLHSVDAHVLAPLERPEHGEWQPRRLDEHRVPPVAVQRGEEAARVVRVRVVLLEVDGGARPEGGLGGRDPHRDQGPVAGRAGREADARAAHRAPLERDPPARSLSGGQAQDEGLAAEFGEVLRSERPERLRPEPRREGLQRERVARQQDRHRSALAGRHEGSLGPALGAAHVAPGDRCAVRVRNDPFPGTLCRLQHLSDREQWCDDRVRPEILGGYGAIYG